MASSLRTEGGLAWLLAFAAIVACYWPAREAGFTSDFTTHVEMFVDRVDQGWWNSFGWRGNQPVLFGLMYGWFKWFGLQALPWFFLFSAFHALNAGLVFRLIRRISAPATGAAPAWIGLFIFALHPYQAEVLVWKVCLHYLISTFSLLGMLLLLFRPLSAWTWRDWTGFHVLFSLALFSLELALIYPLVAGVALGWWARESAWTWPEVRRMLLRVWGPQALIMAGYFLFNRIRLDAWIGHYGGEVHLRVMPAEGLSHLVNYPLKYLLFSRDWPFSWKAILGDGHLHHPLLMGLVGVAGLLVMGVLAWWSLARSRTDRAGAWALLTFFLALAPIITLYFSWMGHNENDRYGYLASAFMAAAIACLSATWWRPLRWALWAAYLGICLGLLTANVDRWVQSQRLYKGLLEDFRWDGAAKVYVLGMPDTYEGIVLFRSFKPGEGLRDALRWVGGHEPVGELVDIGSYVIRQPGDAVQVEPLSDRAYRVSFRQWGNWFLHRGLGASDFRGEGFEVRFDEAGYVLEFDEPDPQRVLIWNEGGRWASLRS